MSKNRNKNSEEIKAEYMEKMRNELGTVFCVLCEEVAAVNLIWNEYKELYVKRPSRIELLNNSASFFL